MYRIEILSPIKKKKGNCGYGMATSTGSVDIRVLTWWEDAKKGMWHTSFCIYGLVNFSRKKGISEGHSSHSSYNCCMTMLVWKRKIGPSHVWGHFPKRRILTMPLVLLVFKICYWYHVFWTQKQWMPHCIVGRCSSFINHVVITDDRKTQQPLCELQWFSAHCQAIGRW